MTRPLYALAIALVFSPLGKTQVSSCLRTPTIERGDSLGELADLYYGDNSYGMAILLATNGRVAHGEFTFIGDPNDLPLGGRVCVPEVLEADRLRRRYDTYLRAVHDMTLPAPWEVTDTLHPIDASKPAQAATWIRQDQIQQFRKRGGDWVKKAPKDIWVTIEPHLQQFCRTYVGEHGFDPEQITLRLEQRLGLPPRSSKTHFVRIIVNKPGNLKNIFRPCPSPETNTSTCALGPPPPRVSDSHRNWIFTQYYYSYSIARPSQYPWTSLGYTFDWNIQSPEMGSDQFVELGESEYVIPKGAPIEIQGVVDLADYCRAE